MNFALRFGLVAAVWREVCMEDESRKWSKYGSAKVAAFGSRSRSGQQVWSSSWKVGQEGSGLSHDCHGENA